MNIQPDNQNQAISDDQELAKALAGVNDGVGSMGLPQPDSSAVQAPDIANEPMSQFGAPATPAAQPAVMPAGSAGTDDPALASVKQAALAELRPLVDKLDVEPEEKFNTYLLLIRSTDDKDLIAPAHEAAKGITDDV